MTFIPTAFSTDRSPPPARAGRSGRRLPPAFAALAGLLVGVALLIAAL